MRDQEILIKKIFNIRSPQDFETVSLEVFRFQYSNNKIYKQFCDLLSTDIKAVNSVTDIPFLPIQFFKDHKIIVEGKSSEIIFLSSGTTGNFPSEHYVADLKLYTKSFLETFQQYYGNPEEIVILALLPSYLERKGSSLIYMVSELIEKSKNLHSGFYLNNTEALINKIVQLEATKTKTLLLGVSYALLDLLEIQQFDLNYTTVMETGGMKGKRKELLKEELHTVLKYGFGVDSIHSEYGMTELLSQAYSKGDGIFNCPPWMKILTRDPEDALTYLTNKTGGINVIDLANLYSCSFIATQDLGKLQKNGSFEVLGRFDNSDVRGCNLMIL